MGTFGLRIRGEREKRGLRLVDVARATRVGAHHLAALEHDDFGNLPDDEIVTGYVRAYAEHLGLDPDAVVADFVRELEAGRPARATDAEERGEEVLVPAPVSEGEEADEEIAPEEETAPEEAAAPVEVVAPVGESAPDEGIAPEADLVSEDESIPVDTVAPDVDTARRGVWPVAVGGGLVVLLVLVVWWWIGAGDEREAPIRHAEPEASAPVAKETAPESPAAEGATTPQAEPVETEPPPDPEPQISPARLSIPEYGVGTRVVNHRLVGVGDSFAEGTRVWFWTLVQGGSSGDTLRHVWIHEGRVTNNIPLTIGGWHWRTHTRKYLSPGSAGQWTVEARDAAGRVLARSEFECAAPGAD